jgi:hypothetical protein
LRYSQVAVAKADARAAGEFLRHAASPAAAICQMAGDGSDAALAEEL